MSRLGYLSWSKLTAWEKSHERFIETYVYNRKPPTSEALTFGKKMADGLENDELTGDPVLDMVMGLLPKFEIVECEVLTKIKGSASRRRGGKADSVGDVPVLAFLDSARKDLSGFKEYKTGRVPWTQRKVDQADQVTFYAMVCFLETGKVPSDIELVYVPTREGVGGGIEATGEVVRFHTQRTMSQVLNMMVRAKKAWREISEAVSAEVV